MRSRSSARSSQIERKANASFALRLTEDTSDVFWSPRQPDTGKTPGSEARIRLASLINPLFLGEIQSDLFDSLALTTSDGRVILQAGNPDLKISNLSKLWRRSGSKPLAELGRDAFAHSADVFDVRVSGSDYTLFIRECCEAMHAFVPKGGQDWVMTGEHGWVLAGLVPQSRLSAAAYAFPFSAIRGVSGLLLLAVFAAPFIKLLLVGELQRVTVHDVLLVGVCALMGVAFVTLFALDRYASTSLADALDSQLQALSSNIRANAKLDRDRAFVQVKQLDELYWTQESNSATGTAASLKENGKPCEGGTRLDRFVPPGAALIANRRIPTFDTFVVIDATGCQQVKWSSGKVVTPLISVRSREYFTHWQGNEPTGKFFIEPIRSATTGNLEAVLSTPATSTDKEPRVAALTIPMRSLLNPTLVSGFGFAVIADDGRVLFHSIRAQPVGELLRGDGPEPAPPCARGGQARRVDQPDLLGRWPPGLRHLHEP